METEKKHNIIYIILNEVNGKTYIGAHSTDNLNDGYMGSGTALKRAQKKYGIEKFKRTILYNFDTLKEMYEKETEIVNEDFIKSKFNYNIKLGGHISNGTLGMVSVKDKDGNNSLVSVNDPRYLSGELVGVNTGKIVVIDKDGNKFHTTPDDPRYLSGELISIHKGMVTVKDKDGNKFQVSVEDPRYLSGELVGINTGTMTVKDKDGNTFQVSMDDPRYLSGELVGATKGKTHNEETRRKIGEASSKHQSGKGNSQYGTCWIYNIEIEKSKKISKDELEKYLNEGWLKGRKFKF